MKTTMSLTFCLTALSLLLLLSPRVFAQNPATIETPEQHFGFTPGQDKMLLGYEDLIVYLQKLDKASPRLTLEEIGRSPQGKPMYIAFISAGENIDNLRKLQSINRSLALDPDLTEPSRQSMFDDGKVFVLATLSMHSSEVGPSQAAPLIAYDLVTASDPQVVQWLDDVVLMMVPCMNPDGMEMVVNHYNRYKGTRYDGSTMPGIYHKYVGHDNNRDLVTLSQDDSRVISRIYSTDWFPQIMVDKHQMGSTGPRYFVPPVHDPIAENVDESVWNWSWILGSNLIKDMTKQELAGVSQHYLFDLYWPGATLTCMWKNVIGIFTECASVKYATPIFIEPTELRVRGKGLAEYKKSINMPLPWAGGWWRLGDIIEYEMSSAMSVIKTASLHRREILQFRNDLCRKEVDRGKTNPPYYYIMPRKQLDTSELTGLVNLLISHGVHVYSLAARIELDGVNYQPGDIVIPLSQPFRPFIKEVLEKQKFPERHYVPGGEVIRPYDITSWSLPLHRGVEAIEINTYSEKISASLEPIEGEYTLNEAPANSFEATVFSASNNESYKAAFLASQMGMKVERFSRTASLAGEEIPAGSFLVYGKSSGAKTAELIQDLTISPLYVDKVPEWDTQPMDVPSIALVETFFSDSDAGWTRYLLDTYNIPYRVVRPGQFEKTDFRKEFDVVIMPSADKSLLMRGRPKAGDQYLVTSYPPEYTKGIGEKGLEQLMTFLDGGGKIVSWGRSTQMFLGTLAIKHGPEAKEEFQLPVQDISKKLKSSGLDCPGSLLNLKLLPNHPLTLGMPARIGVFSRGEPIFATSIPMFGMDRRVIGTFPEEDILLSGYCRNEELLANKVGLVWLRKGKGQLVLFGFNPQFRASTTSSFKLLFNALLLPDTD